MACLDWRRVRRWARCHRLCLRARERRGWVRVELRLGVWDLEFDTELGFGFGCLPAGRQFGSKAL